MKKCRNPIQQSLAVRCVLYGMLVCFVLILGAYFQFSAALYRQYNDKLTGVLTYVDRQVDADDLRRCVETGVSSPARDRLQQTLNELVDDFQLCYLYIVIPREGAMVNVCSATSEAERAAGKTDVPLLETSYDYPEKALHRFMELWDGEGIAFFEEGSGFGAAYTACVPLRDSRGETVALLCADISADLLHQQMGGYLAITLLVVAAAAALFCAVLCLWLRKNVTGPALALERRARAFMEDNRCREGGAIPFESPEIHTGNEIELLSDTVKSMADTVHSYMESFRSAEAKASSMERKMRGITRIALEDQLTQVKSKAAFNVKVKELSMDIVNGVAEFALVMADLNRLKRVNDTYGHEYGNKYLVGTARIVSQVYAHSTVYRVGGDEFVVVLQGEDYQNREELLREVASRLEETGGDMRREPWERYSAAVGMAEYARRSGESVERVLKRADEAMYASKKEMKMERGPSA